MFQTGLPFVTSLLKLPETMTTLYFVGMTALSLHLHPGKSLLRNCKKDDPICICCLQSWLILYRIYGKMSLFPKQGADPDGGGRLKSMAIFGILPQAVVTDIAQSDSSHQEATGKECATRTLHQLGQSLSMLIFTAVLRLSRRGNWL